jgi:D-glycero-D-manno-heptose 1,7-bisphosphate phosphatase
MYRAIFLDRDGVLIENRPEYVLRWSDVKILPNAIQALARLQGYKVVIVTNQSAVGRGLMTLETANDINSKLIEVIRENNGQVDGVYVCPHTPVEQCNCRKPNPGLLLQAAKDLSLDLSLSWMIGDAWSDLLAGRAAGVRGVIILRTGRGSEQLIQLRPENLNEYFIFNDLSEALPWIQKTDSVLSGSE